MRGVPKKFESAIVLQCVREFEVAVSAICREEVRQGNESDGGFSEEDNESTSTALFSQGKMTYDHCGSYGHVKYDCFHNPDSKSYRRTFVRRGNSTRDESIDATLLPYKPYEILIDCNISKRASVLELECLNWIKISLIILCFDSIEFLLGLLAGEGRKFEPICSREHLNSFI